MLRDRVVYTSLLGETVAANVAAGCPQGGVLSPLLWNLVVDDLLRTLDDQDFNTQGYADDIVIIVQGKFTHTVRERMQKALNVVTKWTAKEGLNISPQKTVIVPFTRRRNLEGLGPLRLQGESIPMSGEAKYLGVMLDSKLSWNQHIEKIVKKSVTTFAVVRRMYGKTWGLSPSKVHWLYTRIIRPSITYASLVWWPKVMQSNTKMKLSRIQRLACLGITGAMKSTPTAAMEVILDLPPLDIVIRGEARMGLYRLQCAGDLRASETHSGHGLIQRDVGDPILDMRSDYMTAKYHFHKPFEVIIMDREEWKKGIPRFLLGGLTWYTDGSRTVEGTGAGIYGERPRVGISLSLGQYASVFQAEIYAILQCVRENTRRAYINKRIHIISDSQAALRALSSPKVTSRLVQECREELNALASRNNVKLVWVPGHRGIPGNEAADDLARKGSANTLLGPEPALGIPKCTARGVANSWVRAKHIEHWKNIPGTRHGKAFIKKPCTKQTVVLLSLSRKQVRTITGLLTGHMATKKHLNNMRLYNGNLDCRLCSRDVETALHILCDCEALDRKRQEIFGRMKMEPKNYSTQTVKNLYRLLNGTGILDWVN